MEGDAAGEVLESCNILAEDCESIAQRLLERIERQIESVSVVRAEVCHILWIEDQKAAN